MKYTSPASAGALEGRVDSQQIATYSVSTYRFGGGCSLNEWQFDVGGDRPPPPASPASQFFTLPHLCPSSPHLHLYHPSPPTYTLPQPPPPLHPCFRTSRRVCCLSTKLMHFSSRVFKAATVTCSTVRFFVRSYRGYTTTLTFAVLTPQHCHWYAAARSTSPESS